ncbi:DUF6088 family protein [Flagellimonas sp.]|jgi:hypothetical protein|uniref:DUF6088 family protein n=1 Tax=Flagellimonas sp. TaxID=2058762 RepID=UPI003BAA5A43
MAKAIAKRVKAQIISTGVLALNVLGRSTLEPLNTVYLTDVSARTIKVGKRSIKFKKDIPQKFIGNWRNK